MKTDAEIKKDIMDELKRNPVLCSSCIHIDVTDGIAYLTGKVDSYHKKFEVGNAVKNFDGIKKIHPDINVELPPDSKTTDAKIKDEILSSLHPLLPGNYISVRVYDGIVIITGEADSEQQKNSAMTTISGIPGILNTWNFIRVKYNTADHL